MALAPRTALKWIAILAAATLAVFFVYRKISRARQPAPITYRTEKAQRRRIVGRITASGTLSALVTVQVGSQVSGRISVLNVNYNSPVKKGDVIAKLDPQLFQAAVEQANANFLAAKAGVTKAESDVVLAEAQAARARSLTAQSVGTQAELDTAEAGARNARAQVDIAKASLEQSRAQLNQARVNLSYTSIVSPIDGVVISRSVDVGQTVAASLQAPVLFTIAEDLRKMQVDTSVSEGDIERIEVAQRAFFTVDAFPGRRFRGEVSEIRNAAQTVQNVVTYDAVIKVNNEDLKLRPGMTANVTITYAEKNDALSVPSTALRFKPPASADASASAAASGAPPGRQWTGGERGNGGGGRRGQGRGGDSDQRTIWVMRAGAPVAVSVKLGVSDGTYTEVTDGPLKEGDQVALEASGGDTQAEAPKNPFQTQTPPGGMRRMF